MPPRDLNTYHDSDPSYHHEFDGIHNFRDVGRVINQFIDLNGRQERIPKLKEGYLFRSGRLDEATPSDLQRLVAGPQDSDRYFGVRTVIDLRTKSEHIQAEKKRKKLDGREISSSTLMTSLLADEEATPWETIHVHFIGRRYELQLLKELGFLRAVLFLLLILFQFRMEAIRLVGSYVLSPKGMIGLNLDMLEFCQDEILQTLTILINPLSYPVLVHCTQGKDRSGIITMLVLFVLFSTEGDDTTRSVKLDAIKHDYMLSSKGLLRIYQSMLTEVRGIGMTERYLEAPGAVADEVHQYLIDTYGGPEGYLDVIGFGEQKRELLRKILIT
ncbi:hypothetical protein L218DRAFT_999706 [Marasmius fiardii PR-910]|nr:hypothetical protein L218DRAFT_999706 [Marasmius fiardii PR-910]